MRFPWGLNQHKLKESCLKYLSRSKSKSKKIVDQNQQNDSQRRRNMGLDFLNSMNNDQINNLKKQQKQSIQKKIKEEENKFNSIKNKLTSKQLLQFKQSLHKKSNKEVKKEKKVIKVKKQKQQQQKKEEDNDFSLLYNEYKSMVEQEEKVGDKTQILKQKKY